jgi:hypothetical protein
VSIPPGGSKPKMVFPSLHDVSKSETGTPVDVAIIGPVFTTGLLNCTNALTSMS